MTLPLTEKDIAAFHKFYIPEPNTGCWLWVGTCNEEMYGRIRLRSLSKPGKCRWRGAHRVSYEIHKGSIPEGLCIDHLCRVRCCVNPDHLEAVSIAENIRRGINCMPGMHHAIERSKKITHCPSGHAYVGGNLRPDAKGRRLCKQCHRDRATAKRRARGLPERNLKINTLKAAVA